MKIELKNIDCDCNSLRISKLDLHDDGNHVLVMLNKYESENLSDRLRDWTDQEILERLDKIRSKTSLLDRFCQWIWLKGF